MEQEIYYILFGWLLGLLSAPIASILEKYYKRNDLKRAIFSDLKNIAVRLAATCQSIQAHRGTRNKESLAWIKGVYEKYRLDTPQTSIDNINRLLSASDEDFAIVSSLMKGANNTGLSLKTFSLPYLESVLSELFLFETKFQMQILGIRSQIDILNEDIENVLYYHRLTFDSSAVGKNKDNILDNINGGHAEIERRCRLIVDKIITVVDS
jgi:hypothetical protein